MITVKFDAKKLTRYLEKKTKDIKFAAARALTDTATDIQLEIRRQIPQRFVLRRNWIVNGIRITPASRDNLLATVYSKDSSFMLRQETGGDKRPAQGSNLAIPSVGPRGVKRTKSGLVSKTQLPSALGSKAFKVPGRGGKQLLMMRDKRGMKLLYVLQRDARVRPRLGMTETAKRLYSDRFARHWARRAAEIVRD